jgi:hypothetical protein
VHFEVWVLAKLFNTDEHAAMACGCTQLSAAVTAPSPG